MLSHLDRILFPDRCEVIEIIPSQRYVYVIFKNGHSSFLSYRLKNNCQILINQQIQKINNIDIVIRNPQDRLISGINTFIQYTLRNNPKLDSSTVEWFAQNYLYLNRHYCPQFSWLLNLARYLDTDTKLNFLSMADIGTITGLDEKPVGVTTAPDELINQIALIKNNEMYQRVDMVIFECIGQSLTFSELLKHIKKSDPDAYNYVIGYAQQILNPIYALSQT
jgi:hypothetical protein